MFWRRVVDMQDVFKLPEEGASIFRNQIVLVDGIGSNPLAESIRAS